MTAICGDKERNDTNAGHGVKEFCTTQEFCTKQVLNVLLWTNNVSFLSLSFLC